MEPDPYAVTEKLIHNFRAALAEVGELETEVVRLCQVIRSREAAREIGAEQKAAVVVRGDYATPRQLTVDFWAYFDVLEKPALLPTELERLGRISMEVQLGREELWDRRVAGELTYLTHEYSGTD